MEIEKKEIKRQVLDDNTMIFNLDMERKRLDIEGILTTEYVSIEYENKIERPRTILRDESENTEYTEALDLLLPDDDHVIWTNPRKTLQSLLAEILVRHIT